jgi:rhamnulokinase
MRNYLAFDLGAESGRAMLGTITADFLVLEELHRFANTPVRVFNALYWDTLRLWHEIQEGIRIAARDRKLDLAGIGVDTWGVDFALIGADGHLVDNPRHYRDERNNGMLEKVFEVVPRAEVFDHTGLQFMQLNTLYQLYAMKLANSPALQTAKKLLMIPDLFSYWLSGVAKCELTDASTTQFYDPRKKRWSTELFDKLGLPKHILGEIVQPGTRLGNCILPDMGSVPVYATGSHDTASAVAAVPAEGGSWAYISSGTWSLMGVELDEPVVNEQALAANFTNEIGAEGKVRFLKNIAGLWLLQECRRAWILEGKEYGYPELARMAAEARPFSAIIDPDAFLLPGDMPGQIAAYCRKTGQKPPADAGQYARTIFEGLSLRYRHVLEILEGLIGRRIEVIHLVGGGSKNAVLNQFVADSLNRTVIAGPGEATAIGNVVIQAIGAGELADLAAARALIRKSFPLETFRPAPKAGWDAAYEKYRALPR